jgi:hypothetical protein
VRVATGDTLSGVQEIKTSLDGGALTGYSSDTTFARVLVVQQGGDHSLKIQSFDAAGNMKEVTKYFTVYEYIAPKPTPPPPPPRCTTALTLNSFTASASVTPGTPIWTITVSWSASGGCSPFPGSSIVGSYPDASGRPVPLPQHTINTLSGRVQDQLNCSANIPPRTVVTYSLTLSDSAGHQVTGTARVIVC